MDIQFYKYQGTGNDFILLDNRAEKYIALTPQQIKHLCNRHFGIGADGLMLLNNKEGYDFEMLYYNADGNEGSMCGNGGRCLVQFANDIGIKKYQYRFTAADGLHEATLDEHSIIALKMKDVDHINTYRSHSILNTGSPHYVQLDSNVKNLDVFQEGRKIRYSKEFKETGINVNFVEIKEADQIFVRTYERGVENETYSCGTGVTAAALVFYHNENGFNNMNIETLGGHLNIQYERAANGSYTDIWLKGPAVRVFEGKVFIN